MQKNQLIELKKRPKVEENKKLLRKFSFLEKLISELNKREMSQKIVDTINPNIEEINAFTGSDKELTKLLRKNTSFILKLIEKELDLVLKNHYRTKWMALGLSVFGVPMGVIFGAILKNMAFIGIGIPIGMAMGMAIGAGKDKEAFENGNQLDLNCES